MRSSSTITSSRRDDRKQTQQFVHHVDDLRASTLNDTGFSGLSDRRQTAER